MKKVADDIKIEILISDYLELDSSYKVAHKHGVSATAVKRLLKKAGVLRTQNVAAEIRYRKNQFNKYERTPLQKENLSNLAKQRTGENNPFFGKKHSQEVKNKLSDNAKKRTKDRNPNYKNGKYVRRPRDYKISEFKPLRSFVFNRDKFTCFYCKKKGGHLHAHHILPYWIKPEAFLDEKNLITVCTTCHFEKAHNSNWHTFDISLITEELVVKYSLDRERLSDLAVLKKTDAIV
jgi:hypothetical protein